MNRRLFFKATLLTGAFAAIFSSTRALAAWPKAAFQAKVETDAIKAVIGTNQLIETDKITIKAPPIAENGQTVPITVSTTLENTQSISLFAAKNPFPLSATFTLSPNTQAKISTKIKMAKTGNVVVVVKSNGKYYVSRKSVKVTKGGCGG